VCDAGSRLGPRSIVIAHLPGRTPAAASARALSQLAARCGVWVMSSPDPPRGGDAPWLMFMFMCTHVPMHATHSSNTNTSTLLTLTPEVSARPGAMRLAAPPSFPVLIALRARRTWLYRPRSHPQSPSFLLFTHTHTSVVASTLATPTRWRPARAARLLARASQRSA
jgi:hypothetical protein